MHTNRTIRDILVEILDQEIEAQEEVLFAPSPGNGGDALISLSAYKLLDSAKIKYTEIDITRPIPNLSNRTVIFGGGGGLVPLYSAASDFIAKCEKAAKKTVILPQTIRGLDELLKTLSSSFYIFTRDKESFDYASSICKAPHIFLAEDLALSLDAKQILSHPESIVRHILRRGRVSKYDLKISIIEELRWITILSFGHFSKIKHKTLFAIRSDKESTVKPSPNHPNFDISALLENNDMSKSGAAITTYRMLKFISLFDRVVTDRLHVGIAGHLLGIETMLLDNSYGKISSIYRNSLSESKHIRIIKKEEYEKLTNSSSSKN